MKAIGHHIVIEKIKEAPKSVGGLIIADSNNNDNRYLRASVVSVGTLVEGHVDVGDVIRYDRHAGHGLEWKEKLYHVIKIGDITIVE